MFQNPDDRPIGGSGGRVGAADPYATSNSYQAYDERPINASGQYDLTQIPLDEIEFDDNYSEVELATASSEVLNQVKGVYQDILNSSIAPFTKKKTLEVEEEALMSNGRQ